MMRSMFSGVSGLRAHQTRMDVIGNNIANVNTVAFKSGRVTFQEIFSQTLRGAGSPDMNTGRAGTNPMQIGLGLGIGAIDTITTRGSVQRTDNPTDLSIEGDGFFIVRGGETDTFRFTRAGNFGIDELGYLNLNGMNVQGWHDYDIETKEFNTEGDLVSINLYRGGPIENKKIIPPMKTDKIELTGNLFSEALSREDYNASNDPSETDLTADTVANARTLMERIEKKQRGSTLKVPVKVYDKLGNAHELYLCFVKDSVDDTANTTTWTVFADGDTSSSSTAIGTISFDKDGKFISSTLEKITLQPSNGGTDEIDIDLDFSGMSSYAADNSSRTKVNGYPTGNLVTFSIGPDGVITGIYSNGQQQPLAMIALASFDNPAGLQKSGESLYLPTTNSGEFRKGLKAGTEGVGMMNPGTLEMSNVDLSREFTDMIVTQRGFQANSRIITTSDEMLQELVNLKR